MSAAAATLPAPEAKPSSGRPSSNQRHPVGERMPAWARDVFRALGDALRWCLGGTRALLLPGGLVVVAVVACRLWFEHGFPADAAPLWQLLLGSAGFFYLWWLGILLFDLSFVWHLYIRHSRLTQSLSDVRSARKTLEREISPKQRTAVASHVPPSFPPR